jgi:hypothetical protein
VIRPALMSWSFLYAVRNRCTTKMRFQQARLRVLLYGGTLVGLIQVKKRERGEERTMPTEIPFLIGEIPNRQNSWLGDRPT